MHVLQHVQRRTERREREQTANRERSVLSGCSRSAACSGLAQGAWRTGTRPDEVSAARVARHQQQAVRVAPADVEPAAARTRTPLYDVRI